MSELGTSPNIPQIPFTQVTALTNSARAAATVTTTCGNPGVTERAAETIWSGVTISTTTIPQA